MNRQHQVWLQQDLGRPADLTAVTSSELSPLSRRGASQTLSQVLSHYGRILYVNDNTI